MFSQLIKRLTTRHSKRFSSHMPLPLTRCRALRVEGLEDRALLAITVPSTEIVEDAIYRSTGPLTKVGDLAWLFADSLGIPASQPSDIPLRRSFDGYQYDQASGRVRFQAAPAGDAKSLENDLVAIGASDLLWSPHAVVGTLPLAATYELSLLSTLAFATPIYAPINATGSVDSQGDIAQFSNLVRQSFGTQGAGITVGVVSDSYNRLGGAPADVTSQDLPTGGKCGSGAPGFIHHAPKG